MEWLSHRELVALGWTLLHFLWQGAAIATVYIALNRLTLLARPATRYGVALGALLLMPLSVAVTFGIEMQASKPGAISLDLPHGAAQGIFHDTVRTPVPAALAFFGKEHASTFLNGNAESLLPWVDALWMLGVVLLATRAFGGWLRLQQIRRHTHGVLPAQVQRSFERIKQQLAIHQRVLLRVSDRIISPFAMGIWRATVVVPVSTLLQLSPEELEAVFAHELGHIRRFDYLCNLVQIAIESALFFHPAVWWLSRTVRDRREVCCDAIAVATCTDAIVYARALLHLEEQRTAQLELAMALKGRPGTLLERIQQILGEESTMTNGMNNGVRIAVAGIIVFGLLFAPKISSAVAESHIASVQTSEIKAPAANAQSAPSPLPEPAPRVATIVPDPNPAPHVESDGANDGAVVVADNEATPGESPAPIDPVQSTDEKPSGKGPSYIAAMRDAGYPLDLNNDLNSLISLKSLGVTPEYAKAMGAVGMGKPTVHELISLKSMGVTPEYLAGLKHSGIEPANFLQVVSEKAIGLTPEYATAMKQSGFGDIDVQTLISLKSIGITPEYATWLRKQYPQSSVDELRRAAVFHVDQAFLDKAKTHGFDGKDLDKLLRLKISGLLDE